MFGNKMSIRKKAMESMMKSESPIAMKKKPMMEEMPEEGGAEKEGYEAVMLSPEEKQMIMELRKKAKGQGIEEVEAESEMENC